MSESVTETLLKIDFGCEFTETLFLIDNNNTPI